MVVFMINLLKHQTKFVGDVFLLFFFTENKSWHFVWIAKQMIHMKCQDLFLWKVLSKIYKLKISFAAVVIGTLRFNVLLF